MSASKCLDAQYNSNEDFDKFNDDIDNELLWVRSTRYSSDITSDDNKEDTDNITPNFPWHKEGITDEKSIYSASSGSLRTGEKMLKDVSKNSCASLTYAITNMLASVKKREEQITFFFEIAKFENIEHFLEVEYEKQHIELAKILDSAVIEINYEDTIDAKVNNMINVWHSRAINKYENFAKKVRVIRSTFIRTNDFFREMNENSVNELQKKHMREISICKAKHTMSSTQCITPEQHLLFAQMRERHALEISNIQEMNDKTSAREIKLLEFHLSCTEEIVLKDIGMYKKLTEKQLYYDSVINKMKKEEEHEIFLRSKEYKRVVKKEICTLQKNLQNTDQLEIVNNRKNASEKRYNVFTKNSKTVETDALYRLTFNTRDTTDYTSDSVIDSDGSDDDAAADHSECLSWAIPLSVKKLQKDLQKKYNSSKNTFNKEFELNLKFTKNKFKVKKIKLQKDLQKDIDNAFNKHKTFMEKQTKEWIRIKNNLEHKHSNLLEALKKKHSVDTHILLESNKEYNQTTNLKSNIKAQREMSSHVFHECRNVLASMMAIADTMVFSSKEDLEILASKQKTICSYAVETMNNMLDIVKYQGKIYTLSPIKISLNDIVKRTIDIQGSRVKSNIELISCVSDAFVIVDSHMLTQFMVNLLSNSSKFTENGIIKVIAFIDPENNKDTKIDSKIVTFGISDTGCGMNPTIYEGLDDDLFSINNIDTNVNEYLIRNTGYGLYLSKLIAKNLDTHINLITPLPHDHWSRKCNRGGPGSFTFIKLQCDVFVDISDNNNEPLTNSHEPLNKNIQNTSMWIFKPKGTIKILIADDQELVRLSIYQLLEKIVNKYTECKFIINAVRSAEELIRLTLNNQYDIIFIDQNFDQTRFLDDKILKKNNNISISILNLSNDTNNQKNITEFFNNEIFNNETGDGNLTGVDFIKTYSGNAICIMASGSPVAQSEIIFDLCLSKPPELNSFISNMENFKNKKTTNKLIYKNNITYLKSNPSVSLYEYQN